jgi:ATPase subunit of ABC transporter with duplicated ATPase domains
MTLLVQAANVRHAHGGNQIFEDVSFEVKTGDRVALIGENGAGKSTPFRTQNPGRHAALDRRGCRRDGG